MARPVQPSDLKYYQMLSEPRFSPDGRRVAVSVQRANIEDDLYDSDVFVADTDHPGFRRFTNGKRDSGPVWSPDGQSLLFLSRRQFGKEEKGMALYVIGTNGGEARLLTVSKTGIDDPRWSPDSRSIFYLSGVVEDEKQEEKDAVKVVKRPGLWFNGVGFTYNRRKHLFTIDSSGGEPKQLTKGDVDLVEFAVAHRGGRIGYLATTDDLKPYMVDLFVLDLASGSTRKLTASDMTLTTLAWSPDDKKIALLGNKMPAGFASQDKVWVATLDPQGLKMAENVDRNKSNGLNSDVRTSSHGSHRIVWDGDGIYFLQADGGAVHVYRTKPGKKPELLLGGDRSIESYDVHDGKVAFVAADGAHLPDLFLLKGRKEVALTSLGKEAHAELQLVSPRGFEFRASDGERVEGWVMLPTETAGSVPTILYVHGGPKTASGHSFMHEFQAFVGAGYGVVFLNPRGSDGYSEKFADIRGKYGTRDFQDLMEGLDEAAKSFPQIDLSRAAVAGGSYGGFMANWAVGHTDRFRAAVADRSISSWVSMWGTSDIGPHFTSDQMGGDPWRAEEKLLAASPLRYAPNVKTPLLLVHSMEDYRCWMVEGIQFFTALKQLGKEAELVLFPGENHDLSRVGKPKHRITRLEHYLRWFDAHLKTPQPTAGDSAPSAGQVKSG
jgi:dipeptidyl aminopeptidase/acylaminoacyl peptidase